MSETSRDRPNEHRLTTDIDGEEARLLVHIEPIENADDDATEGREEEEDAPPDCSGLAE